jgi:hypothetical protein
MTLSLNMVYLARVDHKRCAHDGSAQWLVTM